jgi:hypothetical protein
LSLQQLLGNQVVLSLLNLDEPVLDEEALQEEQSAGEDPKAAFTREVLDQIVTDTIAKHLKDYNNIPVLIKEDVPIPGAEAGQAAPIEESGTSEPTSEGQAAGAQQTTKSVTKKIKVRAVYFINRDKETVAPARKAAGFGEIADAIDDNLSELMGGNNKKGYYQLRAGRAVELGKATPEDIELFVNQAVKSGEIRSYGQRQGVLKEGEQLVSLGNEALQGLVQDWMYATGVGVDCSGFISIVLYRAREKVRQDMLAAGVPEDELPRSLHRLQRPQLKKKKALSAPTELRPGDVWLTADGGHVRVIMQAYESVSKAGTPIIEFITAESTTTGITGPFEKKWQTGGLKSFKPIKNIAGGGPKDGSFYRVQRAI